MLINPSFSFEDHTMGFYYSHLPITIISPFLVLLISNPLSALSQGSPSTSGRPTLSDCTSRLFPLTPCAPFVQGMAQSPAQSCCGNLNQLALQQPACLCLLLNTTNIVSFPINTTLALQLPALCNIPMNISTACSSGNPDPVPHSPPASQVSLGADTNSSVAASPMVQVAPRPITVGLGLGRSAGINLKADCSSVFSVTLGSVFITKIIYWT